MRILNVSAFFPSHGGGVEIVAAELAAALSRRGHDSRLTGAAFDPVPTEGVVQPVPLACVDPLEKWAGLPMPLPTATARETLKQELRAADAVIIHDALYATSQLARRYAEQLGKPWILMQHIGAIRYTNRLMRHALSVANRLVTQPMLERAPQAVFISDTVRRYFSSGRYRSAPELLFNGIDKARFYPVREALPMRARPRLLFVGRFVEKKGLAVLRAFAQRRPDCDLLMVGGGPIDPTRWGLENIAVLGRKGRTELAELYRSCDALVLPSVGEGFPLVVQEAMACGLLIFCGSETAEADPGASAFMLGIEIDLADPQATASRLSERLDAASRGVQKMAAEYACQTYDWDRNAVWLEHRLLFIASAVRAL